MKEISNMKSRWPVFFLCALAILLLIAVQQGFSRLSAQSELPAGIHKGFGYAAYDVGIFSSAESDANLEKMADIGADSISIVGTIYQIDIDSTDIFTHHNTTAPDDPSDPYPSTPSDQDFEHVIGKAKELGMTVKLKIHLDLQQPARLGDWRGDIGQDFSGADWSAWFASYTNMMVHYANLAEKNNVDIFTVGTELVETVRRPEWDDVIEAIREVYSGKLVYAANHGNERNVAFSSKLDYIGVDSYFGLTKKVNPNVSDLLAAWNGPLASMDALNDANGLPIILTEIGYLNADGTNMHPWCYTAVQNCDVPPEASDPQEQALLFEALFQMMNSRDYFEGVYIWDFRTEPSSTCDIVYSPYNKPAENVIRSWFGAETRDGIDETCESDPVPLPPDDPNAEATPTPTSATIDTLESVTFDPPPASALPIEYKGIGYAQYNPGAYSTALSDETIDAIAATGAEWVSILATWYQEDGLTTEIGPNANKSPTDIDVVHAITKAHSVGLKVLLKPHVDYNNTRNGTWWRGEVGLEPDKTPVWPDGGTEWDDWFASYQVFIEHYATIAEENDVEMFAVGTELESATKPQRTGKWEAVIAGVRDVYSGPLIYAANHSGEEFWVGFWALLDFIGVDAYYNIATDAAATVEDMELSWDPVFGESRADDLENLSDLSDGELGDGNYKPLIFTEIGYRSVDGASTRPWYAGQTSQGVDLGEQVDAYQALLNVFSKKVWWKGVFWWAYDIEPDDSGTCDDGYSPHDKPVENLLRAWYGAEQRAEIEASCTNPATPTPMPTATPIIIPAPLGNSSLKYADITIYDIDSTKYVTALVTMPNYVNGISVSEGQIPNSDEFEFGLEEKAVRDLRGTEICGYILPPVTGDYQFAIAGDDASWLLLSSDTDPANLERMASHPFWTGRYEWNKYPETQISTPVALQKGQPYRFLVQHINRFGGDSIQVGWKGPGFNMQLIGADYLWPCSEAAPTPVPHDGSNVTPEPKGTATPGGPTSTPVPATPTPDPAGGLAVVVWGESGNSGRPGSEFVLVGSNFKAGEEVVIKIDVEANGEPTGTSASSTVIANSSGKFEVAVVTTDDTTAGTYAFSVVGYPELKIESLVIEQDLPKQPTVSLTQRISLPPVGTSSDGEIHYLPLITN